MAFRVDLPLSRVVVRGEAATLTLPVRDDDDLTQTATGGTVTLYVGSTVVVDAATITSVGPPASYSLPAATTTDLTLSDEWVEVWDLTGLEIFTVRGYLVRRPYHSRVTDQSLKDHHPEILGRLPPGETSAIRFRRAASRTTQRKLISEGRRPWLIFDSDRLHDPETYTALALWARDCWAREVEGPDWLMLAADYESKAEAIWGSITFGHDDNEDGTLTEDEDATPAQSSGVVLSAGRPGGWRRGWRGLGRPW